MIAVDTKYYLVYWHNSKSHSETLECKSEAEMDDLFSRITAGEEILKDGYDMPLKPVRLLAVDVLKSWDNPDVAIYRMM